MKIKLKDIQIVNRAREVKQDAEFDLLKESIQLNGLVNPLTVSVLENGSFKLLCGARRLSVLISLYGNEYETECTLFPPLTTKQEKLLELDENLRRKNFTWFEEVKLKGELWSILVENTPQYKQKEFSDLLGQSKGLTSLELNVYFEMLDNPALIVFPTLTGAAEKIRQDKLQVVVEEKNRRVRLALNKSLISIPSQTTEIKIDDLRYINQETPQHKEVPYTLYSDALEMLNSLPNSCIDCCVTDPPFGLEIERMRSRTKGIYSKLYRDIEKEYNSLLTSVIAELTRVMKPGTHLYMFFSFKHYQFLIETFTSYGFSVYPHPLIWVKQPLAHSSTQRPEHYPAMAYEPCLLAFNAGDKRRLIQQGKPNVIIEQVINPSKKRHPLEFPVEVYKNLMARSCSPGDTIIDPFCGSGSSIQAALELGLKIKASEQVEKYSVFAEERALKTIKEMENKNV